MYLSSDQTQDVSSQLVTTLEVTPVSHSRACEIVTDIIVGDYGFKPRRSLVLLCVKLAHSQWRAIKQSTKQLNR